MPECDNIEPTSNAQRPYPSDSAPRAFASSATRSALLRRFAATPFRADLRVMQRTLRMESDSEEMLALAMKFFARHQHGESGQREFNWRIVVESESRLESTAVQVSAFSSGRLRYVNLGQRSFLALDLEKREAKAFLDPSFLESEARFKHRPPLDILFSLSSASLGLAALSGGCVGNQGRGVLVFGPPNSGKTTASYLAATRQLEFHSDQLVFLDLRSPSLIIWGDLFPAVFRPGTLAYLPELRASCRHSTYGHCSYYYLDKSPMQPLRAQPVAPVCSLFLDRNGRGRPHLSQVCSTDAMNRLQDCMLFSEDAKFEPQIRMGLAALAKQPAYTLTYDSDPRIAADAIERMPR
jgi:hypothetical protein